MTPNFTKIATTDVSYNETAKAKFLRESRKVLREIAKALGYTESQYDIRTNKAGIAVSGEVTLHSDTIYIQFSQGTGLGILYRSVKHRRDYSGGANNWMSFKKLEDFNNAIATIKRAERKIDVPQPA